MLEYEMLYPGILMKIEWREKSVTEKPEKSI